MSSPLPFQSSASVFSRLNEKIKEKRQKVNNTRARQTLRRGTDESSSMGFTFRHRRGIKNDARTRHTKRDTNAGRRRHYGAGPFVR